MSDMTKTYSVEGDFDKIVLNGKVVYERNISSAEDYNDQLFKGLDLLLNKIEDTKRQTGGVDYKAVFDMAAKDGVLFVHNKHCIPVNVSSFRSKPVISGTSLDDLVEKTRGLKQGDLVVDPTAIWVIYRTELKKIHDKIATVLKTKE